ncbi:MAG: hypothetical protein RBS17_01815 [Coriobacteriia bacterium]|nr:hypothetical protein [Coriobacteriia bacterium]
MLYIEDSDDDLWLDLVELLSERQIHDMVLCLYPGSGSDDFPEPFSVSCSPDSLEQVIVCSDGNEPPCSGRVRVSGELLDLLRSYTGEFEDWGDSLLLYQPRERQWVAAFIPHQRIALVKDVRLQDFLDAAGIKAGTESPPGLDPSLIDASE